MTTVRRRMARWMADVVRKSDETWIDYIARATHWAEDAFSQHGSCDWVALQRQRKWKFAGKVAADCDQRWDHKLLTWKPWFRVHAARRVGRPTKRWEEDIASIAGGSWPQVAKDKALWSALLSMVLSMVHGDKSCSFLAACAYAGLCWPNVPEAAPRSPMSWLSPCAGRSA